LQMFGYSRGASGPTVPGSPTIGTATATGSTTATVAYTAPASDGGSTITSYTATSSPGGITGTLSQAGSGTITVSGLTASTSYTFTVYATNSIGNSAPSAASNSITTTGVSFIALSGYSWSAVAASSTRVVGSNFITTINGNAAYGSVPALGVNTTTGNNSYAVLGGSGATIYPWAFLYYNPVGPAAGEIPNTGLIDSSGNIYAFGSRYGGGTQLAIANKTNSSGIKQWGLNWGTAFGAFNSVQWDQGGYIMGVGGVDSGLSFFTRISEGGSVLISRYTGSSITMTGGDVDTSGNYILTGFLNDTTSSAPWAGKYDSGGAFVWSKSYTVNGVNNGSNRANFRCMIVVGTDIYVGGYITDNNANLGYIAKLSGTDGSVIWQKNYSPFCGFSSVTLESDGYLYWGGQTGTSVEGIIVKTDTNGTQSWSRYIGGITCKNARAIISGSTLYITGTYNIPNYAPYYIKVPNDGSLMGTYTVGAYSVTYGANAVSGSTASSLAPTSVSINFNPTLTSNTDTYSTSSTTSDTTTVTII
jgi:hypothetical protein